MSIDKQDRGCLGCRGDCGIVRSVRIDRESRGRGQETKI